MRGEILHINNLITCNVFDCDGIAKFKWFYKNVQGPQMHRIGNSNNIISWMGFGDYICEVECNGITLTVSTQLLEGIKMDVPVVHILQSPSLTEKIQYSWDFSRLPEDKLEEVKRFIKEKNKIGLAQIHNDHQLSSSGICCGSPLEEVLKKFKDYVKSLPRAKSKVVEGSK